MRIRQPKKPQETKTAKANMLTAGRILKARREELNLSIEQISAETKIQKRYLSIIEEDSSSDLESTVFIAGFIKIYAEYLSLDEEKILALYRRTTTNTSQPVKKSLDEVESRNIKEYITPQVMIILLIASSIIGLFAYIGLQFYRFQKEPYLIIASPTQLTFETDEENLLIKGQTESGALLTVNEDPVSLDSDDKFEFEYNLKEGNNTLIVKAVRNNNKKSETVKVLEVKYTLKTAEEIADQEAEDEVVESGEEYKLRVEVSEDVVWLQVVVDDTQQRAEVLEPGFSEEYTVTSNFEVVTGRPTLTKVFINGEEKSMVLNSDSGTAKLSCKIEKGKLKCD